MSKDSLQLPKTAFSMKASLPTKEPEILKKWDQDKIFEKLRKISKGKEKSVAQPPSYKADIISIYKQLLYSYVSFMWLSISRVNTKCNNAIPYRIYIVVYISKRNTNLQT